MVKFDVITIFPELFRGFVSESLLARAQKKKLIKINLHNLRKWTTDNHKTVDGRPYGGGAGMVLKIEPIWKAVQFLKRKAKSVKRKTRTILLSAKGKTFDQKKAQQLAKYDQLIFICGRYEGVDERVRSGFVDEEISIGDYILTGGEFPAMIIVDAVARLVPGVLGCSESPEDESFSKDLLEYPQYTRPPEFEGMRVPDVLLSGNHAEIIRWRRREALRKTILVRPDLLEKADLLDEDKKIINEIKGRG